jgi:CubicO group peptidase (beta-lactamase class C family)
MRSMLLLLALLAVVATATAQAPVLRQGRAVSGTLAPGDTARYTIEADSGFFAWAAIDQRSVDVIVRVLDPAGKVLTGGNALSVGVERVGIETKVTGANQLQVIPAPGDSGAYTVTLDRIERVATDPRKLADQLFRIYDHDDSPGGEVAVFRNGKAIFAKAYGMADLTHQIPFTVETPTNIGSTSKQFTAFAIMLLVEEGKVDLDADVRSYIPELPDLGEVVRVRHLLTHTSGYREFLNLTIMAGRRLDHGDYIDRGELISIVQRQPALQNSPGAEWNYNNTAFGLLAVIVERLSGMSFPEFMVVRVFGPLGMTHTRVRQSPEAIVPGMAQGYTPGGPTGYIESRDLFGAMGAGGIYSTAGDLGKWLANYANPTVGSRASVDQMMTRFVLTEGDTTNYGFGLFVDSLGGIRRVQHGGADIAHRSMLMFFPTINAGLTTQSNHAGFNGSIANRLAKAFFAEEMTAEPTVAPAAVAFDSASYDPADFDQYVGRYALDAAPTFVLAFTRNGDSLFTQATGQPRIQIYPTSDSTFELRVVEASLSFHRTADDSVTGVTLHQGGANQHATRLAEDGPAAWKPDAEVLQEFAGRYLSDELETFYTLVVRGDTLVARQRRLDDIALSPAKEDAFDGGDLTWAFERDRNGEVIGFYLANGRSRDVRFGRVR